MRVAKVIDQYTVAITKKDGPFLGIGDILCIGSEEIVDPETDERLGKIPGLCVKVTKVYDKFVVAETYRIASCNELGQLRLTLPHTVVVDIGDDVIAYPEPY